ncbi:hypothetical protein [Streptomyces sp. NPDC059753]|uniref:hypothetical protein n=1 Tax=Streptomyces sp. NPDC059753 TaxID=3346933 RepID=UPI0036620A21
MIIVYTPAGGQPEHHDVKTLKVSEASIVSRSVDMTWGEIKESLGDDNLDAMRGIVWVLKKRAQPTLRLGDFDPGIDEMVSRFDHQEAINYVEAAFGVLDGDSEITREDVGRALEKLPDICADPEHARGLIAARVAAPKDQPDTVAEPSEATVPAPNSQQAPETQTSASSETSTSDSSATSATSPHAMSTT